VCVEYVYLTYIKLAGRCRVYRLENMPPYAFDCGTNVTLLPDCNKVSIAVLYMSALLTLFYSSDSLAASNAARYLSSVVRVLKYKSKPH